MNDVTRNYPRLEFAVETLTPELANEYLCKNLSNRKLSGPAVTRWANAMRAGEWKVNGESIKFNTDDELVDGQHRLKAVVVSGVTVDSVVIRGLEKTAFETLDSGKGRNWGDCLYILNYKNPNALAAAARMLIKYETRYWEKTAVKHMKKPSSNDLLAVLDRHPELSDFANQYMLRPQFTPLIPHSVGMFCYYLASRIDKTRAKEFFAALASGEGHEAPVRLHQVLEERRQEYIKPSTDEKCAWVIQAWNACYNEKPLRRLSRIVETAPRFDPDPVPAKA